MSDSVLPANIAKDRREDPGSRKVIERLDRIESHLRIQDVDLEVIRSRLPQFVTYKWLIVVALAFAFAVVGVTGKMVEENRSQREAAILLIRQEQVATNLRLETKVDRQDTKLDGLIKYFFEGKSRAEVRAELRAEEKAAEPLPKPANPMAPGGAR